MRGCTHVLVQMDDGQVIKWFEDTCEDYGIEHALSFKTSLLLSSLKVGGRQ